MLGLPTVFMYTEYLMREITTSELNWFIVSIQAVMKINYCQTATMVMNVYTFYVYLCLVFLVKIE